MAVKVLNATDQVTVEVISEESGVAYDGADYYQGDTFTCTQNWALIFAQHGKVRILEEGETPVIRGKKPVNKGADNTAGK